MNRVRKELKKCKLATHVDQRNQIRRAETVLNADNAGNYCSDVNPLNFVSVDDHGHRWA